MREVSAASSLVRHRRRCGSCGRQCAVLWRRQRVRQLLPASPAAPAWRWTRRAIYILPTARIIASGASPAWESSPPSQGRNGDFAGDNAPVVSASLDSPRSVAISPAGLLTLADSGNQRVRQLDALPTPGPDTHTIAGLELPRRASRSAVRRWSHGSGSVTATLTAATTATGSVTFLDTSGGTQTALGTAGLISDSASFSISTLAAGAHSLVATYAGDASHGAAQSSALAMTVTPLAVTLAEPRVNPLRPGHSPAQRRTHRRSRARRGEGLGGLHFYRCGLVSRGTLSHLRDAYRQRYGTIRSR